MNQVINIIWFFLAVAAVVLGAESDVVFVNITVFLAYSIPVILFFIFVHAMFGGNDFDQGVFFSIAKRLSEGGVARGRMIFYIFVYSILILTLSCFFKLSIIKYYILLSCIFSLWVFRNEFPVSRFSNVVEMVSDDIEDIYNDDFFKKQEKRFNKITDWLSEHNYEIEITKEVGSATVFAHFTGVSTSFYVIGFVLLLCGIIPGLIWYIYYNDDMEITIYLDKDYICMDTFVIGKKACRDLERIIIYI